MGRASAQAEGRRAPVDDCRYLTSLARSEIVPLLHAGGDPDGPRRPRSTPICKVIAERAEEPSPARSTPTSAAGSRPGTWTTGAARPATQAVAIRPQPRQPRHDRPPRAKPAAGDLARQHVGQRQPQPGHGNEFHSHPGSFWSGVYYVDDGGIAADPALGGELEFMDPRGAGCRRCTRRSSPSPCRAAWLGRRQRGRHPERRPAGDVPGLAAAPGAALSRRRRAHLHRLQSQPRAAL